MYWWGWCVLHVTNFKELITCKCDVLPKYNMQCISRGVLYEIYVKGSINVIYFRGAYCMECISGVV